MINTRLRRLLRTQTMPAGSPSASWMNIPDSVVAPCALQHCQMPMQQAAFLLMQGPVYCRPFCQHSKGGDGGTGKVPRMQKASVTVLVNYL